MPLNLGDEIMLPSLRVKLAGPFFTIARLGKRRRMLCQQDALQPVYANNTSHRLNTRQHGHANAVTAGESESCFLKFPDQDNSVPTSICLFPFSANSLHFIDSLDKICPRVIRRAVYGDCGQMMLLIHHNQRYPPTVVH